MNYEALIRTNFIRHASLLPSLTGNMEVQRRRHLIFVDCGLSCDTFNIVFITDGQQLPLSELKGAVDHYRQKKFDFCVWVDDRNLTGNARDILPEAGLSEVGNEPGMYLSLEDYKSVDNVGQINKVVDKEQVEYFAQMLATAWSPPDSNVVSYFQRVSETLLTGKHEVALFIYHHDGQPASLIELFPDENKTAGIYNLFTLPDFRGKGIATALMNFSLDHLKKQGFETVILQASEDGLEIYKRLGFKVASRFYEFQLLNGAV